MGKMQSSSNVGLRGRTKRIHVKLKYTRENIERGAVDFEYIPSRDQLANTVAERLRRSLFETFAESILSEGT